MCHKPSDPIKVIFVPLCLQGILADRQAQSKQPHLLLPDPIELQLMMNPDDFFLTLRAQARLLKIRTGQSEVLFRGFSSPLLDSQAFWTEQAEDYSNWKKRFALALKADPHYKDNAYLEGNFYLDIRDLGRIDLTKSFYQYQTRTLYLLEKEEGLWDGKDQFALAEYRQFIEGILNVLGKYNTYELLAETTLFKEFLNPSLATAINVLERTGQ